MESDQKEKLYWLMISVFQKSVKEYQTSSQVSGRARKTLQDADWQNTEQAIIFPHETRLNLTHQGNIRRKTHVSLRGTTEQGTDVSV